MCNELMVSVCCTTYNQEKYIADALEGFIKQKTNFRFEVYVHDDASTDKTVSIVKKYAEKYPDIIKPIFQEKNQYSQGVKIIEKYVYPLMKGKYFAFCEGDDYWVDDTKLQKQVDFLEKNNAYVACVHNSKIKNCINGEEDYINKSKIDYDIDFTEIIKGGNKVFQLSSLMARKEYTDIIYSEDKPGFFRVAKGFGDYPIGIFLVASGKVRYMAESMSVYRLYADGSWTSNHRGCLKERDEEHLKQVTEMLRLVDEYMDYKYSVEIKKVIEQHEFINLVKYGDYRKIKCDKYRYLYEELSVSGKLKIMIKHKVPFVYKCYKRMKRL